MAIQELNRVDATPQTVIILDSRDEENVAWDAFVSQSPQGLPTQLFAWKGILNSIYGYPCYFLATRVGSEITGVLPLFHVKSPITGNSLQSMPGGACVANEKAAETLLGYADALAQELEVDLLLVRDSRSKWTFAGLEALEAHRGVVLNLSRDPEEVWKRLPKDVRYHIRHGKKQGGVKIELNPTKIQEFYNIFSVVMKNLGTPIFAYEILSQVSKRMSSTYKIALVYYQEKVIGGFFNFVVRGSIYGMWGGVLHEYRQTKATQQAYWAMIEDACESGIRTFDMGRSPYPSKQYDFKEQWGDWTYPIYQLYKLYRVRKSRMLGINDPENSNFTNSIFRLGWRKLPLRLTQFLGPKIRWHVPFG